MATLDFNGLFHTKLTHLDFSMAPNVRIGFAIVQADGVQLRSRTWTLRADGSGLFDENNQPVLNVSSSVVASLCATLPAEIDSIFSAAIAAGKCTL